MSASDERPDWYWGFEEAKFQCSHLCGLFSEIELPTEEQQLEHMLTRFIEYTKLEGLDFETILSRARQKADAAL